MRLGHEGPGGPHERHDRADLGARGGVSTGSTVSVEGHTHDVSDTHRRGLVVEDEESYSEPLAYMLKKEGYDAVVAATGTDGLEEFERSGADLVLLDVMLPGMSGVDVCRQLRTRSSVPIIMLTARAQESDIEQCFEAGATTTSSSRSALVR